MLQSALSLQRRPRLLADRAATTRTRRTKSSLRRIRGVLFDLDGTLISRRQDALVTIIMTVLPFVRALPSIRRMCALDPDTQILLRQLRQQGFRIGILSNSRRFKLRSMKALGLDRLADCVLFSAEIGAHKPQHQAFADAAARLGVAPAHILYVGDRLRADMRGAHAAGMRTMWITRRPPDASPVDVVGRSVLALREALGLKPPR